MRGSRPVASYRPKGYGKPVKTAHYDLDCLSAIEVKVGTYETINSLQQINCSIVITNIVISSLSSKFFPVFL